MNKLFTKVNYFIAVIIVLMWALTPANAHTHRVGSLSPARGPGKSVLTNALQVITFNPLAAVTYGAVDFSPGASSDNSGTAITYSSDNVAVATIVNGDIHIVGAGAANITASQPGETSVIQPLTVNQAPLTITPNNVTKTYGTVLTGAAGSTAFTTTGLQYGETLTSITPNYTSGSAATDGIGTYTDCVGIAALGGGTFNANNYAITYAAGNIIVNTAALTITANNVNKTYGSALTGGAGSAAFTSTGLQNGETIGSVTINYGSGSATTDATGTYTGSSTATSATGGSFNAFDYTISYLPGNIIVAPAPLVIKAHNKTIRQGSAIPTLTVTYKGFVNGDTEASLTTQPTITTTGTSSSPVGVYPIVASGAVDPNYTITYVAGTLAITSPDDASLRNLRLSSGTLSPAFDTDTKNYTIGGEYGNKTTSITVTPVSSNPNAGITVNGNSVKSGKGSVVPLAVGSNAITVVVVSKNGQATETYTLTVTRLALTNAYLSYLKIDDGQFALTPAFVYNTLGYAATVPYATSSITVTPSAFTGQSETIAVNGTPVISGAASGAIALTQGANTVTVLVTAEDGTTTQTYTLTITRAAPISNDASLSNLTISNAALSPAFTPATTSYTIGGEYGNKTTSVTITPTATNPNSTVTINGNTATSGSGTVLPLAVGSNVFAITVLSQDGTKSKTYTLTVTRLALTNAYLSFLKIDDGQFGLTPSYLYTTLSYAATVPYATSSITVTPSAFAGQSETISVNGTPVTSGAASGAIALIQGANTVTVLVTAEDGTTTQTYTLTVNRAAPVPNDASLANLNISEGTLSPAFAPDTTSYTIGGEYGNKTTSLTITATATNPNSTITINGNLVTSGSGTVFQLVVGSNTFSVKVLSQDGSKSKTYVLTVTRLPLTNAYLSYLKLNSGQFELSPSFVYTTLNYTADVPYTVSTVSVTANLFSYANETVTINGMPVTSQMASAPIALNQGANTIIALVTAEDGVTTETYTLTITREASVPSSDAYLSYLRPVGGNASLSPAFVYTTTSYTASVPSSTASITLTPTTIDKNATITVNGTLVLSGSASAPIQLVTGPNPINTTVTAQDGVTTQTYTVIVTKTAGTGSDNSLYQSLGVAEPLNTPQLANDGIVVHQGVSPNGDGVNDFLMIDGIGNYPDNKLMIMNRNGQMIFEAKNYDNSNRVFDGHSNKSGAMQLPGTYFYSLDYAVKGVTMHKTGFIILKY